MRAERGPSVGDGLVVRVQVPLCGDQRSVTGDLAQNVYEHACISHPGQAGVAQIMTAKMLIAEGGDDLIPMGRIAQDSRGDSPPRGPVNRRAIGSGPTDAKRLSTSGRTSSIRGTVRARLPLVPLSIRPPGPGVVCLRTVQVQASRSILPAGSRQLICSARATMMPAGPRR